MSKRRLFGIDRSGSPPPQTRAGEPWRPWTIPNAVGYVRLALIPVFLVVGLSDDDGIGAWPAALFGIIGFSDYLDGMLARATGQYSRLGALLDPLVDRLLVMSGVIVVFDHNLLPRWALAVLAARELFMLGLARYGLRRGVELKINWAGRIGVGIVMGAPWFAMLGLHPIALAMLYTGLVLTLTATALYMRYGMGAATAPVTPPPSSSA